MEEKKQASWATLNGFATVTMPDGQTHTFDFSKLSNEVFAYYGKKQWLADKVASKQAADKLSGMIDAFNEASKNGVGISETGRIYVIGKERANAAPKTMDSKILPLLSTYTPEEIASLKGAVKMGLVAVSEELMAVLETL